MKGLSIGALCEIEAVMKAEAQDFHLEHAPLNQPINEGGVYGMKPTRIMAFLLSLAIVNLPACATAKTAANYPEPEDNCSAIYVGRDVSTDGTTIIARCADTHPTTTFVYLNTTEASNEPGRMVTGKNGFQYALPDETFRYISVPRPAAFEKGHHWDSAASNEKGLAVTATITGYLCPEALEADPYVEDGLSEDNIAGIVAACCDSSREGIERIASIIDTQGSAESNIFMVADPEECWYMEIYTGHQYAAVRLPTDLVAGFGNEFMLDTLTGFDEVISSAALETLPAEKGFAVYNEDGTLNLFSTYSGENRLNDYGNLRTWRIHNLLAPSTAGEYDTYRKYDLLYAPDEKVSTEAVIDIFRDRFEGSSYEAQVAGGKIRILATETASQVHVQKIHHDLPPEIAVETWQCFSNANYAPFIPLPNCLSSAPEAYTYQIPRYDYDAGAAACRFKTLNALSAQDREHFGSGIEAMWQEYETIWAGKYREALKQAAALWAQGDADEAIVLLNDCANQAMDQALKQTDTTITDLMWYIMQDVDTLRYTFSYETLTLSEEPYERTPFMPLVNAAEYAALNDWNCENQEEGLLLTKGDTTIRITPSDGKRTSKGSVMIGNEEPQSIVALQRDAGVYIPLDQAMQLLKSAA